MLWDLLLRRRGDAGGGGAAAAAAGPPPPPASASASAPAPAPHHHRQQHHQDQPPPPPRATTDNWSDGAMRVEVVQPGAGFSCCVKLAARVDLPPAEVFDILTDPANARIFRTVRGVLRRVVLRDDGVTKEVEVHQLAGWRFGPFRGTFVVPLRVTQDRRALTIRFRLASPRGGMRDFTGGWQILPFTNDTLDEAVNFPGRHWGPLHGAAVALHSLEAALAGRRPRASLVRLEQSVAPALAPPPPLDRILRKIATMQVRIIMEDLNAEVARRNAAREAAERGRASGLGAHIKELGGGGDDDEP